MTGRVRDRRLLRRIVLHGVVPAILLGMGFGYLRVVDYVETDPAFCGLCHVTQDQYALWTESSHSGIVCQECHHQGQGAKLELLGKFLVGSGTPDLGESGGHDPQVSIDACSRCHMHHDENWWDVSGSAGHRVHVSGQGVGCLECHARSIHKFGATSDACRDCHSNHVDEACGMENLHCLACHNFLSRESSLSPLHDVCTDCHASRGVAASSFPSSAPMASLECAACHKPHRKDACRGNRTGCGSCHEGIEAHGLHSLEAHSTCTDCHAAHAWVPTVKACRVCHDDKVEHHPGEVCWSCHGMKQQAPGP